MLPYVFKSLAELTALVHHYGWHLDGDDIKNPSGNLVGWIMARGKRQIRVAWCL